MAAVRAAARASLNQAEVKAAARASLNQAEVQAAAWECHSQAVMSEELPAYWLRPNAVKIPVSPVIDDTQRVIIPHSVQSKSLFHM